MASQLSRRGAIGVVGGVLAAASLATGRSPKAVAQPNTQPQSIFIIRHAEKPAKSGPPFGVDVNGNQNHESLLPRGWQRSGGLIALFDPPLGAAPPPLRTPTALYAPVYKDLAEFHRTYQTVLCLSEKLGIPVRTLKPYDEGPALAEIVMASTDDTVLISWEHRHIPGLAQSFPTVDGTAIPPVWPDHRFDVIWTFILDPVSQRYAFGQIPQRILVGDSDTVI